MKRTLSFLFAILLLLTATACGKEEAPAEKIGGIHTESGDVYPENFLTFDGQAVSFDEFRYYYLNYRDMYLAENADYFQSAENEKTLKEEILQCLLDSYAVRFLAKENKVSLNREEKEAVQAEIEETVAVFGSEEAFLADLMNSYMSRTYYETMMEYSSLYYKLFNTLFEEGGKEAYSDEEFYEYFQANYLAVQQIYLPFADGETKESHSQTLSQANQIREEAVNGGDFWSLVQKYGQDDNMLDYPDGYYFTEGQAEDALYQAAKELNVGDISRPVVGETGLYIIKRMEMKKARMEENRDIALFGYRDTLDEWHGGEYDRVFFELYRKRAGEIKVETGPHWDLVSTKSVF